MPTHDDKDPEHSIWQQPEDHAPEEIDASAGYEKSDVKTRGILVFLTALAIFVVVTAVLCYGIGMVLNAHMRKEDGPRSKWAKTVDVTTLGNMASSPELQNKMATMTQQFPTPRLQTDDGSQEIVDLHAKEDLLLENYSWVDQPQGKVRIPIERAMELIAQRGLPVAPTVEAAPLLTGDVKPVVAVPLTNGFARTGYEQDVAQAEKIAGKRGEQK
ncbi:MAG: hypothetical protein ABSF16_00585 [Terracidiphilus sp.]|jgi:hypothetical protein